MLTILPECRPSEKIKKKSIFLNDVFIEPHTWNDRKNAPTRPPKYCPPYTGHFWSETKTERVLCSLRTWGVTCPFIDKQRRQNPVFLLERVIKKISVCRENTLSGDIEIESGRSYRDGHLVAPSVENTVTQQQEYRKMVLFLRHSSEKKNKASYISERIEYTTNHWTPRDNIFLKQHMYFYLIL